MQGPVVMGSPVPSKVLLIGQAPGFKEIEVRKPFAWTAGKTMFGWFSSIGLDEDAFRGRVYMAAVCRCFPGKNPKGGDRVGKLAIGQLMDVDKLTSVVGRTFRRRLRGVETDVIPLPHPSGASTWHRTEPGLGLLKKALRRIKAHPAWKGLLPSPRRPK